MNYQKVMKHGGSCIDSRKPPVKFCQIACDVVSVCSKERQKHLFFGHTDNKLNDKNQESKSTELKANLAMETG